MFRQFDLLHQDFERLPCIHPGDDFVVDILNGIAHSSQCQFDVVGAANHIEVSMCDDFGLEADDVIDCVDVVEKFAVALAPDGIQVGKHREVGARHVAGK